MSSCQCRPGDRKYGLTTTVLAPSATHASNASAIVGGACACAPRQTRLSAHAARARPRTSSMCAACTTARPVCALYASTRRSCAAAVRREAQLALVDVARARTSWSLDSALRDPWSTSTTPTLSPAAATPARTPRARARAERGAALVSRRCSSGARTGAVPRRRKAAAAAQAHGGPASTCSMRLSRARSEERRGLCGPLTWRRKRGAARVAHRAPRCRYSATLRGALPKHRGPLVAARRPLGLARMRLAAQ